MADEPQPVENVNQEVPAQDKNETTLENDAVNNLLFITQYFTFT